MPIVSALLPVALTGISASQRASMLVSDLAKSGIHPDFSPLQFSAPDLSAIARGLDEDERQQLDDGGRTEVSMNMDDTGACHIVLHRASE